MRYPKGHLVEKSPTLRKVIYKNWHRMRNRYLILGSYLSKNKWSWKADFWWAKVQRKKVLLRRLCEQFTTQQECSCVMCIKKTPIPERVAYILSRVKAIEDSLEPYKDVFAAVPRDYGYACISSRQAKIKLKIDRRKELDDFLLEKWFKAMAFQSVETAHKTT